MTDPKPREPLSEKVHGWAHRAREAGEDVAATEWDWHARAVEALETEVASLRAALERTERDRDVAESRKSRAFLDLKARAEAAERERDGWRSERDSVSAGEAEMRDVLRAVMRERDAARAEMERLTRERDLALAHDREVMARRSEDLVALTAANVEIERLNADWAKERAEHVTDVACGERRLIRCEAERDAAREDAERLAEALEKAQKLKGGWREAIVLLEDFTADPVRLKNMLAAADQLDDWAEHARAALSRHREREPAPAPSTETKP